MLYAVFGLLTRRGRKSRSLAVISGLCFSYLFLDILLNALSFSGFYRSADRSKQGGLYLWDRECAVFDPVPGYRFTDSFRVVSVMPGKVLFDEWIRPNKQGYIASADFTPEKKDASTRRYIVFGDSFTAGAYLAENWPDRCAGLLAEQYGRDDIELYNFSVDGGGIVNWHSILFSEIIPNYAFDGIILAVFSGDLNRDFYIMHHQDRQVHIGSFAKPPADSSEFADSYLPQMHSIAEIPHNLDSLLELADDPPENKERFPWRVNAFREAGAIAGSVYFKYRRQKALSGDLAWIRELQGLAAWDILVHNYGEHKTGLVREMTDWCAKNAKEIIIAGIPHQNDIVRFPAGQPGSSQIELDRLSEELEAPYFDGVEIFKDLSGQQLQEAFIPGDIHWSQRGSDHFADHFAAFLDSVVH